MMVQTSDAIERSKPTSSAMLRDGGRVSVGRRGPGVWMCRLAGLLGPSHTTWMLGELERALADEASTIFIDASQLQRWAASERDRFDAWCRDHHEALEAIHLLTDDPELFAELAQLQERPGSVVRCHAAPGPFFDLLQGKSDDTVPAGDDSRSPA